MLLYLLVSWYRNIKIFRPDLLPFLKDFLLHSKTKRSKQTAGFTKVYGLGLWEQRFKSERSGFRHLRFDLILIRVFVACPLEQTYSRFKFRSEGLAIGECKSPVVIVLLLRSCKILVEAKISYFRLQHLCLENLAKHRRKLSRVRE